MWRDLTSRRLIYLKGLLFLLVGLLSSILLVLVAPNLRVAILLVVAVWSFCRFYYFLFYVIERYVDPGERYAGIFAFLRRRLRNRPVRISGPEDNSE